MKKLLAVFYILAGGVALAALPKVWAYREVVAANDLNANFSYLYSNLKGASFTQLVDADIATGANINQDKIASGTALPRAFVRLNNTCTAGTCALGQSVNVTSVVFVSTGVYNVTLPWTTTSTLFGVIVTAIGPVGVCMPTATAAASSNQIQVTCVNMSNAVTNSQFTLTVYDTTR